METISFRRVHEIHRLIEEVNSWTDEEIAELPKLYRAKAREIRRLTQQGQE